MAKQKVHKDGIKDFEGGRYARTEEELYKKALAVLEKCRIETRRTSQEIPEPTAGASPKTV